MNFPVDSSTRYFTNTHGRHFKFWDISGVLTRPPYGYVVRFGRIGSGGSVRLKKYTTRFRANAGARRIIAEKTSNGYEEHAEHCNGFPEERAASPRSLVEGLRSPLVLPPPTAEALGRRGQEGLGPLTTFSGAAAGAIRRANESGQFLNSPDTTSIVPEGTNPTGTVTFTIEPASRAHAWSFKEASFSYWCAQCHSEVPAHLVQNSRDGPEIDALLGRHCQGMSKRYSEPEPEPEDPDPGRMITFDEEK